VEPDRRVWMNVALVVSSFEKGELEQVVLDLYYGYKKNGWNAYIMSQTRNIGDIAKELDDIRDIFIFDGDPGEFIRFCGKHKIEVLHYHYNTFMMTGNRKRGYKILYTMHNAYAWMSAPQISAYSSVLEVANKVVPVSSFVENYFRTLTGFSAGGIETIPNGVDFSELDGKYDDFPVTRKSLGFADSDVVVAGIASFHPAKHQVGLIGVMEKLQEDHPEIKLLLVGNEGDKDYHNYFMKLLDRSPAKENIRVIPYFDHKYMGQFLRDVVDIFTLPALYYGFSNAVLEAAYCAKPMVLTNVGNAEDMKDIASCKIVKTAYEDLYELSPEELLDISLRKRNRNTKELAKAFSGIAKDLDAYKAKAAKAVESVSEYNTERMVEKYIEIIEEF